MDKNTERNEITRERLIKHYQTCPELQIEDIFKYLFQSAFGCEHLVSDYDAALEYIKREYGGLSQTGKPFSEMLDGAYSRVPLSWLDEGLTPETLAKLFCLSSQKEPVGMEDLISKIEVAKELADENLFGFSYEKFEGALDQWRAEGYPPVHHSDTFRELYRPSYRVIANKYVKFLPLFAKIDGVLKKGSAVIAVEGGSASGKTTLGKMLSEIYDCTVFHMDDFFLRPEQRTPERLSEAGGNIDWERFLCQVLIPLKKNAPIEYRRFDCSAMKLAPAETVIPKRLTVVEGAYSMHPELAGYYDLSVFLDVSSDLQKKRIQKRNSPEMAQRFFCQWIPLERTYFLGLDVKSRCDLTFNIDE